MRKIFAIALLFLVAPLVQAQSFGVSGAISLPDGVFAPSSGVRLTVLTDPLESFDVGGGQLESSITVTIPPNGQSASYALTLKDDPLPLPGEPPAAPSRKKLRFTCDLGCEGLGVSFQGFWNEVDGVVSEGRATVYTATQNHLVDITLARADSFAGVVRLPDGRAANGDETIQLIIRSASFSDPISFAQTITTEEAQTEWPFFISVPQLDGVGGWTMLLSCRACGDGVLSDPHFPTSKTGDPMTLEADRSFFFVKFASSLDMQMTFLKNSPPVSSSLGAIQLLLLDEDD